MCCQTADKLSITIAPVDIHRLTYCTNFTNSRSSYKRWASVGLSRSFRRFLLQLKLLIVFYCCPCCCCCCCCCGVFQQKSMLQLISFVVSCTHETKRNKAERDGMTKRNDMKWNEWNAEITANNSCYLPPSFGILVYCHSLCSKECGRRFKSTRSKAQPRRGGLGLAGAGEGEGEASRDGAKTSPVQTVLAEAAIPAALSFYYIASINVSVLRTLCTHTERERERGRDEHTYTQTHEICRPYRC